MQRFWSLFPKYGCSGAGWFDTMSESNNNLEGDGNKFISLCDDHMEEVATTDLLCEIGILTILATSLERCVTEFVF